MYRGNIFWYKIKLIRKISIFSSIQYKENINKINHMKNIRPYWFDICLQRLAFLISLRWHFSYPSISNVLLRHGPPLRPNDCHISVVPLMTLIFQTSPKIFDWIQFWVLTLLLKKQINTFLNKPFAIRFSSGVPNLF